jgi:hypothetical protein
MTTAKVIEAAELYLSRQPVYERGAKGEPLYAAGQMLRAFCAGEIAVIDPPSPQPHDPPMAWWWEDKTGCLHLTLDRSDVHEMAREMFCEPQPLYSAPPPQPLSVGIKTSIDTMREAAKDLLVKNGWKPGSHLSGHSVAGLMAEFGMRVQAGDVGCDYPNCGCCADAACADAVKQHPDLGGSPALAAEGREG